MPVEYYKSTSFKVVYPRRHPPKHGSAKYMIVNNLKYTGVQNVYAALIIRGGGGCIVVVSITQYCFEMRQIRIRLSNQSRIRWEENII